MHCCQGLHLGRCSQLNNGDSVRHHDTVYCESLRSEIQQEAGAPAGFAKVGCQVLQGDDVQNIPKALNVKHL